MTADNASKLLTVMTMNMYFNPFLCVKPVKAKNVNTTPVCGMMVNTDEAIAVTLWMTAASIPIAK